MSEFERTGQQSTTNVIINRNSIDIDIGNLNSNKLSERKCIQWILLKATAPLRDGNNTQPPSNMKEILFRRFRREQVENFSEHRNKFRILLCRIRTASVVVSPRSDKLIVIGSDSSHGTAVDHRGTLEGARGVSRLLDIVGR